MANRADYNQQETDDISEFDDAGAQSDYYNQAKDAARKTKKAAQKAKKTAEVAAKSAKNTAVRFVAKGILYLLPYISVVIIGIIILIVLISFIVYLLAAPDTLRQQILDMTDDVAILIKTPIVGAARANVLPNHVTDVGKYIENMGFDLISNGFVTPSEISAVDSDNDGKIDTDSTGQLKEVKSEIIADYITSENRTYMQYKKDETLRDFWFGSVPGFLPSMLYSWYNAYKESDYDSRGMINVAEEIDAVPEIDIYGTKYEWDKVATDEKHLGSSGGNVKVLGKEVKVDRVSRKMLITIDEERLIHKAKGGTESINTETRIVYNLQGWVGRYGKPVEFLLALHLGTMAPRFAQTVATSKKFDTQVNLRIFKAVDVCKLKVGGWTLDEAKKEIDKRYDYLWNGGPGFIGYNAYNQQLLNWYYQAKAINPNTPYPTLYTDVQVREFAQRDLGIWEDDLKAAIEYEDRHTEQKYTPYIASVEKHWYKDLKFKDLEIASSDDAYVVTYPSTVPKGETVLRTATPKYVTEYSGTKFNIYMHSTGDIYQIAEPKPKQEEPNKDFDELFTNELWYKMDGTRPLPEDDSGLPKSKINPEDLNMQSVIIMLNKAEQKSDDAKYIVRDLREYLTTKGFKFYDDYIVSNIGNEAEEANTNNQNKPNNEGGSSNSGETTSTSDKTNNILGGKTANIIYSGKEADIKTSEIQSGVSVNSIVDGKIEKVSNNAVQIKITTPGKLEGKTVIISGVNMDSSIQEGSLINKNTPFAKTSGSDIRIRLYDENRSSISVKEYLKL